MMTRARRLVGVRVIGTAFLDFRERLTNTGPLKSLRNVGVALSLQHTKKNPREKKIEILLVY